MEYTTNHRAGTWFSFSFPDQIEPDYYSKIELLKLVQLILKTGILSVSQFEMRCSALVG